ncbi:P-type conjugative transfer protein TrbL, partial [Escherichia coli]|nr:P-type conjugative transfer protein TrbL [Escherichia coli]
AGAAGGASALQAAFQKASASMETGGDMSSMGSVVSSGGNGGGEAGTAGSSPFAQAAGFGDSGSSSSGGGFAKAAKLATGTASELAKGVGSQVKQGFQERVSETTGGKLAASIRESMEPKEASQSGQFEGNSLGADSGPDSNEVRS